MAATPNHATRGLCLSFETTPEDIWRARYTARENSAADSQIALIGKGQSSNAFVSWSCTKNSKSHKQAEIVSALFNKTNSRRRSDAHEQNAFVTRKSRVATSVSRVESARTQLASKSYVRAFQRIGASQGGRKTNVETLNCEIRTRRPRSHCLIWLGELFKRMTALSETGPRRNLNAPFITALQLSRTGVLCVSSPFREESARTAGKESASSTDTGHVRYETLTELTNVCEVDFRTGKRGPVGCGCHRVDYLN